MESGGSHHCWSSSLLATYWVPCGIKVGPPLFAHYADFASKGNGLMCKHSNVYIINNHGCVKWSTRSQFLYHLKVNLPSKCKPTSQHWMKSTPRQWGVLAGSPSTSEYTWQMGLSFCFVFLFFKTGFLCIALAFLEPCPAGVSFCFLASVSIYTSPFMFAFPQCVKRSNKLKSYILS